MKTNLKGTGLTISSEVSNYLDKRLEGIEKFLPVDGGGLVVDVELGKTTNHHNAGEIFRAEINIHIGGRSFRAVSEREDLLAAIDEMKDEITRELSSHKEKRISLVRRGGQKLKEMIKGLYRKSE